MDIGALVLKPFEKAAVAKILGAINETACDEAAPLNTENLKVAFSYHREMPGMLFIHFDWRLSDSAPRDPYLFFADMPGDFGGAGFGPGVSGYLGDAVGEENATPTVWTCLRERRTGACTVHEGFMYTYEGTDDGEDEGPLRRLAAKLEVADYALWLTKLEAPDTVWLPIGLAMPDHVRAELEATAL